MNKTNHPISSNSSIIFQVSADDQCSIISRQFALLKDEMSKKESEIISDIKSRQMKSISEYHWELTATKSQLERTQKLIAEAKQLKMSDPITTLRVSDLLRNVSV